MSTATAHRHSLLWAHLKIVITGAIGVVAAVIAHGFPATEHHHLLIGWDVGAIGYLIWVWRIFLTLDEGDIRARAAEHDEKSGVLLLLVLALIAVSLAGIVEALFAAKTFTPQDKVVSAGLVALTLALGWLMLQSVFTAHYAHRHYVETARNKNAGIGFPGEPPTSYLDFFYLAFSVGATFQVSDNSIGSTRLRKLVTAHAAAAYIYNTAILAVGINLLAGFVTQ
ncbi:MAG: DUF1345 domain-containing protein [Caulobacterales bacterium]|nr:DUF1345 domain-containing protein [Caulobacterales bacterium]